MKFSTGADSGIRWPAFESQICCLPAELLCKGSLVCLYLVNSDEMHSPISLSFVRVSTEGQVVTSQQILVLIVVISLLGVLVIYVYRRP